MTDNLDSLSDTELSEVFAVEVAGWSFTTSKERTKRGYLHRPPTEIGASVTLWKDGGIGGEMPKFSTSADAVLPFAHTFGHDWQLTGSARLRNGVEVPIHTTRIILRGEYYYGEASGAARSLCVALIRASRVALDADKARHRCGFEGEKP